MAREDQNSGGLTVGTDDRLFQIESQGFDVVFLNNGATIEIHKIEDSSGAEMLPSTVVWTGIQRDTWYEIFVAADQTLSSAQVTGSLNGLPITPLNFTGSSNGVFPFQP